MQHNPVFQSDSLDIEPIFSLVLKTADLGLPQPWTAQPLSGHPFSLSDLEPDPSSVQSLDVLTMGNTPVVSYSVLAEAKQFDQDFLGHAGNLLNGFVESGQIWALLIGIAVGYLIRGMTTYS